MKKKIFISFAIEDKIFRDFLVGQSRNSNSPFEFIDMSVKQPWISDWKTHCRTKIKGCDGMVALISKNTANASGEIFEIECAYQEGIPIMLMHINGDRSTNLPRIIQGRRINIWSWSLITNFINKL